MRDFWPNRSTRQLGVYPERRLHFACNLHDAASAGGYRISLILTRVFSRFATSFCPLRLCLSDTCTAWFAVVHNKVYKRLDDLAKTVVDPIYDEAIRGNDMGGFLMQGPYNLIFVLFMDIAECTVPCCLEYRKARIQLGSVSDVTPMGPHPPQGASMSPLFAPHLPLVCFHRVDRFNRPSN